MPRLQHATPKYRLHRPSGQAVVTIQGHDHYLGLWKSKASRIEFDRLVGEWLAAGRPDRLAQPIATLSVVELARDYWRYAKVYYGASSRNNSGYLCNIKTCLRFLKQYYGHTPANEFGPLALKAIQSYMVAAGQSRSYVNGNIRRIRNCFKWGVAQESVPVEVYQALATVPGLRKGHTTAPDPKRVKPVSKAVYLATLPHLPRVVRDMVRVQRLCGARPEEICLLQPSLIDRIGQVWCYIPAAHKTEYLGHERKIFLGPKAQKILKKYLARQANEFCFSPFESERLRHLTQRSKRQTPLTPSQARRRAKRHPKRNPGVRYTPASYRRAIHRAAKLAKVEQWSPNRLRHTAGTFVRNKFGLEAAQALLGHSEVSTTQIYAERASRKARKVTQRIG